MGSWAVTSPKSGQHTVIFTMIPLYLQMPDSAAAPVAAPQPTKDDFPWVRFRDLNCCSKSLPLAVANFDMTLSLAPRILPRSPGR